jgi:DNA repair protein RecN (Recombination protein N)
MLKSLYVRNYALIRKLDIEFFPGLTVITGETGAGKSILLGALSLILGQRADSQVLLDKNEKCIVEGIFDIAGYRLSDFFSEYDLDYDDQTSLRREMNRSGKSRAFINDTPVNLNVLKELGMKLVDIHSQHHNILLGNNVFQLQVVDTFAKNIVLREKYRDSFLHFRKLTTELEQLTEKAEKAREELDYYNFQLDQLEKAQLVAGEDEELEKEFELLSHTEEIASSITGILNHLDGEGEPVLNKLREIKNLLEKIKSFYPQSESLLQRFQSIDIELGDLYSEFEYAVNNLESEPGRLDVVKERLDLIYSLEQKHHVDSVSGLIRIKEELQHNLDSIFSDDNRLEELGKQQKMQLENLKKQANELSESRKKVIPVIEKEVEIILRKLGIPNAQFRIQHNYRDEFISSGKDQVDFVFSANKNAALQNLKKVASGGELSRLMLSLKSLITSSIIMPTIIFDEIDTGVSGDIADKVGEIISGMAADMQVINITHLPQIACKGEFHYLVYKSENKNSSETHLRLLRKEERVEELAKMLSGKELTNAALANARELLGISG